jgi:hypothetical protein
MIDWQGMKWMAVGSLVAIFVQTVRLLEREFGMTVLLFVLGYLLMAVLVARVFYVWESTVSKDPEPDEFITFMVGIVWPIALAVAIVAGAAFGAGKFVFRETGYQRRTRIKREQDRLRDDLIVACYQTEPEMMAETDRKRAQAILDRANGPKALTPAQFQSMPELQTRRSSVDRLLSQMADQ